ncbi:MAG TPA: lipid A export permease/ATP-binding protein MsbA [Dokdonella sp.]|uniref:lipid A export permease/ATP-binding protein MsbA n=1 Tax=Dokdonella sp. TaxID=2291710 RepID=UPI002D7F0F17|nr:lipid A export permease/ATP-binding protein MsbA [Dokdonella sp.]HET9034493.1 lipid A export permease/ATP-binding protein MsbA [Dokdonella sp.]
MAVSAFATYRRLLGYAARYRLWALAGIFGMIFDAAVAAVFTAMIRPMLDDLFISRSAQAIFWMPFIIVGLFVIRGVATYVADYGLARIGRDVVETLRGEVFSRYLVLPTSHFDREASGQMISRLTYTVEQVAQASTNAVKVMILDSLTVLGLLGVMLYQSARLTLMLFIMAPLIAAVAAIVGRRYRRISGKIQHSVGSVTGIVDEAVGGQREVKVYLGQAAERARFAEVNEQNRTLNLKIASTNAMSTSIVQIVAACALALVIFFATRPSMLQTMSPGTFMSLITAMLMMLPSLKRLTTVQAMMQRGVAAAEDLFKVIDTPAEVDQGSHATDRCRGEIELRDVVLRYPGQATPALDGINLHCPPGTVTALVGRSGSGKSTLASLIPRFYEPDSGSILLDGQPLDAWRLENLRNQIAWVGQQIVLFNDSIAHNIAYGALAGASREAIEEAAQAANAMEFISQLGEGLDAQVGEGGALLSGGQRQRIAIARALLKDAPLLILDEATSALDTESERLIQDALKRLLTNRTVIVIAHRLSTIEHADQIAVLDGGRIVERGTHRQLLDRDGHYAALHRVQFRENGKSSVETQ